MVGRGVDAVAIVDHFLGKWAFDLFSSQGLAKKIPRSKTIGLILANLTLVVFIIFIRARR